MLIAFIIMWCLVVIICLLFCLLGYILLYKTPKINKAMGYRTKRSMENEEKWNFANKFFGKLLFLQGFLSFMITIISIIVGINLGIDSLLWAIIVPTIELLVFSFFLLVIFFIVEKKLIKLD